MIDLWKAGSVESEERNPGPGVFAEGQSHGHTGVVCLSRNGAISFNF